MMAESRAGMNSSTAAHGLAGEPHAGAQHARAPTTFPHGASKRDPEPNAETQPADTSHSPAAAPGALETAKIGPPMLYRRHGHARVPGAFPHGWPGSRQSGSADSQHSHGFALAAQAAATNAVSEPSSSGDGHIIELTGPEYAAAFASWQRVCSSDPEIEYVSGPDFLRDLYTGTHAGRGIDGGSAHAHLHRLLHHTTERLHVKQAQQAAQVPVVISVGCGDGHTDIPALANLSASTVTRATVAPEYNGGQLAGGPWPTSESRTEIGSWAGRRATFSYVGIEPILEHVQQFVGRVKREFPSWALRVLKPPFSSDDLIDALREACDLSSADGAGTNRVLLVQKELFDDGILRATQHFHGMFTLGFLPQVLYYLPPLETFSWMRQVLGRGAKLLVHHHSPSGLDAIQTLVQKYVNPDIARNERLNSLEVETYALKAGLHVDAVRVLERSFDVTAILAAAASLGAVGCGVSVAAKATDGAPPVPAPLASDSGRPRATQASVLGLLDQLQRMCPHSVDLLNFMVEARVDSLTHGELVGLLDAIDACAARLPDGRRLCWHPEVVIWARVL